MQRPRHPQRERTHSWQTGYPMNHFDVGLDKGRSKTNLAVARADGQVVLEARIEHFDQLDPQPVLATWNI